MSKEAAETLKKYSKEGKLTPVVVVLVLCSSNKESPKISLPEKRLREYFPNGYSKKQMETVIYELLDHWKSIQ